MPSITIIYPRAGQVVGAVDSTFIFGHLPNTISCKPKDAVVFVNGHETPVHCDGGFLAFVPVVPGEFTFELAAYRKEDLKRSPPEVPTAIAAGAVTVSIPEPLSPAPDDSLRIVGMSVCARTF